MTRPGIEPRSPGPLENTLIAIKCFKLGYEGNGDTQSSRYTWNSNQVSKVTEKRLEELDIRGRIETLQTLLTATLQRGTPSNECPGMTLNNLMVWFP